MVMPHPLARLAGALREEGLTVNSAMLAAATTALGHLRAADRPAVYWGLRLTLCWRSADLPAFDRAFSRWYGEPASGAEDATAVATIVSAGGLATATGGATTAYDEADGEGAAAVDVALASRDFAELTPDERAEVNRLIVMLAPALRRRRTARRVPGGRGSLDLRRAARLMLRGGGESGRLPFRRRVDRPRRLLLLIDCSASMREYVDALLRFAHAAVAAAPQYTEVFTIGPGCTRITVALRDCDPDRALAAAAAMEPGWGGGTELGRSIGVLLRRWGGRCAIRAAVVVLASDGFEHGDPAPLARQVARLSRLADRLIWVNPQRRTPGFRAAMPALVDSLPFTDAHLAGHTVQAYRELTEVIADVSRPRSGRRSPPDPGA